VARPSVLVLVFAVACAHTPSDPTPTLRTQTQALLDAVAVGDRPVWDRLLDPRAVYVSENGTVETKASLLAQLDPLPTGITGSLKIATFAVTLHGDTAIVVHEDHETVSFFGQPVTADYRSTDTWRRGPDGWRLLATHVHAVNQDPPEEPLADLDAYVGTYRLSPTMSYGITRDGDHLMGRRTGGKPHRLAVEVRDVLFVPGQPRTRKIFRRDARGAVTSFVDRREGRDITWQRI